ncbi:MAG: hypothetical protein HY788_10350 [Deltaproteobacteria bacterium]|nr:hypothetical protein [Deltaproteobacteria bacterium]
MAIDPIDLRDLRTTSLSSRKSKVHLSDFGAPWQCGGTLRDFLKKLPSILAAADFNELAERIACARKAGKSILLAMGAHPIKVGLNPVIVDLMEHGFISGLAMNGAGIIHDSEVAMAGKTSEDVGAVLGEGGFGMAEETATLINTAVESGTDEGMGLGAAVGHAILRKNLPYKDVSILAAGARLGIPVTVHVAIGTDIVHMHPSFRPDRTGAASHLDFRIFARLVSQLEGGVLINLGSAVILPEVFLKALSLVRNLGHQVSHFTTANMDFVRHYRPITNVVQRPTQEGGKGFHLTGHHEIMFPLLAAAILEASCDPSIG